MMRWVATAWLIGVGCKSGLPPAITDPLVEPDTDPPIDTDTDTDTDIPIDTDVPPPDGPEALALPPAGDVENPRFATSGTCAACHSNHSSATAMRDADNNPVGMYDSWEASMMANASRDPIWRAVVSAEIAATPNAAAVIGERCMTCHAPLASRNAALLGDPLPTVAALSANDAAADLGLDGVSCTLCHQIEPSNFAGESSWGGNYSVESNRIIYGPHNAPETTLMAATGWVPQQSSHTTDSRLCATCHTFITNTLDATGTPTGSTLVEQSPYLEMRNSTFATSSCQNCHMPPRTDDEAGITTRIARDPSGVDYDTLGDRQMARHILVGGNTLGPRIFAEFHDVLNPRASVAAFQQKETEARFQLQQRTAFLFIENEVRSGNTVELDTRIEPRTGHKFPTGIPLRRAWIQLTVTDGSGQMVFSSGAHDTSGRIVGVDGMPLPFESAGGPIEPHHDQIDEVDQVQIYEAIMKDDAEQATFHLLQGAGYLKDNRLLPLGWSPSFVDIDRIAPQGVHGDADYRSGGDNLHWVIDVGAAQGPFAIEARLNYQTLSNRFTEELFLAETPETNALRAMLQRVGTSPEVVALYTRSVP